MHAGQFAGIFRTLLLKDSGVGVATVLERAITLPAMPESSIEFLGHSVGGVTYRHLISVNLWRLPPTPARWPGCS